MTGTKPIILVLLVVGAFGLYLTFYEPADQYSSTSAETGVVGEYQDVAEGPPTQNDAPAQAAMDSSDVAGDAARAQCISDDQIIADPLVVEYLASMAPLLIQGPDIEAYRGVDHVAVLGFAEQGDSAAMAVAGAGAILRALGEDESGAVEWLSNQKNSGNLLVENINLAEVDVLALNDAAYWFYEAALHGRIFALQKYGAVRSVLFGGPVGLGWIDQAEFDALDSREQIALNPGVVYLWHAMDLVPQISSGAMSVMLDRRDNGELGDELSYRLQQEFSQALADAGLPEIKGPTTSPEFDALIRQSCDYQNSL